MASLPDDSPDDLPTAVFPSLGVDDVAPTLATARADKTRAYDYASELEPTTERERLPMPAGEYTSAPSTTVFSAATALAQDELLRSRLLGKIGVSFSLLVLAAVPFLGGDPIARVILIAAAVCVLVTNLWLIHLSGDPSRFRPLPLAIIWHTAALAIAAGIVYFGVFSAAPIAAGLGIYLATIGGDRSRAPITYGLFAVIMGAVAVMSSVDVIRDPGLITAGDLSRVRKLLLHGLLQGLLLGIYILGRHSRKATEQSVFELEEVMRAVSQRDALLEEARFDLRHALHIGGAGAWTGRRLGDYELGAVIGRGAMGEVYEATGRSTGVRAAVKLLTPVSAADPRIVARFRREVEIAQRLESDFVVEVLGVSTTEDPIQYIVMELLQGGDLAALLRERPVLESREVVELADCVAAGIDAAAGSGVVHRDVKPQNLFRIQVGRRTVWKILDFGVSKLAEQGGNLTQGDVVGTPTYMAPEQAQSNDDVDNRADVYGLAAIAYRCLTGRPPFHGRATAAVLINVISTMPLRPTSVAELPRDVDFALAVGMAKAPESRFSTGRNFAAALASALAGKLDEDVRGRARALLAVEPWREP